MLEYKRIVVIRVAALRESGEISGLELNSYELLTLYDPNERGSVRRLIL